MESKVSKLVFVAGATGGTGIQVVNLLLEKNHKVRALVRDLERAKSILKTHENLELVIGDVNNIDSIKKNLHNVDGIICTIGASGTWFGPSTPYKIDYLGVRNLIDATKSENINNFVLVSSTSVTHTFSILTLLGRIGHWKVQGENHLKKSGLNYFIVRPAGLTNELTAVPKLEFRQDDNMARRIISRKSTSEVCYKCLSLLWQNNAPKNITFEVSNDRSTSKGTNDWEKKFSSLKPDQ